MTHHVTQEAVRTDPELPKCVEHGVWVPIPREPPPGPLILRLKDVDPDESAAVKRNGVMTFHMTGCTGHFGRPVPQAKVAAAMARQIAEPNGFGGTKHAVAPSFFYHLGDIVYKDEDKTDQERADQQKLYNEHFYSPYSGYANGDFPQMRGRIPRTSVATPMVDGACIQIMLPGSLTIEWVTIEGSLPLTMLARVRRLYIPGIFLGSGASQIRGSAAFRLSSLDERKSR